MENKHKQHLLYDEFSFNNKKIAKNRLVLAPMTNCQSEKNGRIGKDEVAWLIRCAQGGFGTLITACAHISPEAQGFDGQLGIGDDSFIDSLQGLIQQLKPYHSLNLMQLTHAGVRAPQRLTGIQPSAPSVFELNIPHFEKPRALNAQEIANIVEDFATATKRAYEAGFDGVEIHGANGYLITQFISTVTNLRQDQYGGSLQNRARFIREITLACRKVVPTDFLVGMRLSSEGAGLDIDENLQIAQWLKEDGASFIHLSAIDWSKKADKYPHSEQKIIHFFRQKLGKDYPLMVVGGIQTPVDATTALEDGADFAALGRIALGNANWPLLAQTPNFTPVAPPYSTDYLQSQGITDNFLRYIKTLPLPILQS